MKYRESCGERITPQSPVIRDLFHPDRGGQGEPHLPKPLKSTGVKRLIEDALKGTGTRKPLEEGKRRHEFQADHGFRKFFKSVCERQMKSLHVEILMGHDVGLAENYYRPSEDELLESYLKAVPELTIVEHIPQLPMEDINELKRRLKELEEWKAKEVDEKLKEVREWQVNFVKTLQAMFPKYSASLNNLDEETKAKVIEAWRPVMELKIKAADT